MKYYYLFYWAVLFISCSQPSTEKYHKSRDNIVNVKAKIVEIPMDSIPCNNLSGVSVFQDKFIITDIQSYDCQIHLFDHKTFRHLASTAPFGQGPKEITNMGDPIFHPTKPEFSVEDL